MAKKKKDETVEDAEIVPEKKSSNMLLYILIPVLLLAGVGGGIFLAPMFHTKPDDKDKSEKDGKADEKHEEEGKEDEHEDESKKEDIDPKKISFIPVPDVLVNLKSDQKRRPVFLKVSLLLEVHDPAEKAFIEPMVPKVVDQMQTFLRDLDVADVTGANNMQRLRRELQLRVNNVMSPHKVQDVLIKEFLVQ